MGSEGQAGAAIHVALGTKAQYIKTAPVIRELLARGVPVRLIDLGQHGALASRLRAELGLPEPDVTLGGATDVVAIPQALLWGAKVAGRTVLRRRVRDEVFGGLGGVCVVHGDTPSTFLAVLLARRAGVPVAHLEAGLRSRSILHPFPEELIRRVVMRFSDVLYAPDDDAIANLHRIRVGGRVVASGGNSGADSLLRSLGSRLVTGDGPAVFTMHRVENLHRSERVDAFVDLLCWAADRGACTFVVHGPTAHAIERHREELLTAGVELVSLLAHQEFVERVARARFVVTDGGSIQEECAFLGVPTLLWRAATERSDGLGENVVLSRYDIGLSQAFMAEPQPYRRPPRRTTASPSATVAADLATIIGSP